MLRRSRLLFCAIVAITLPGPTSANAQYATIQVEHDWTITVFGGRFGYEQMVIMPYGNRTSRLYWAGGRIPLASSAGLRGMLPAVGIPLAAVALVVWRIRAKRRAAAP